MTYIVSLMATEYLFEFYPDQIFKINMENVVGYDIESMDETLIAECFAATSYRSNGKLLKDLNRLDKNQTASDKYEFFYDRDFSEKQRVSSS